MLGGRGGGLLGEPGGALLGGEPVLVGGVGGLGLGAGRLLGRGPVQQRLLGLVRPGPGHLLGLAPPAVGELGLLGLVVGRLLRLGPLGRPGGGRLLGGQPLGRGVLGRLGLVAGDLLGRAAYQRRVDRGLLGGGALGQVDGQGLLGLLPGGDRGGRGGGVLGRDPVGLGAGDRGVAGALLGHHPLGGLLGGGQLRGLAQRVGALGRGGLLGGAAYRLLGGLVRRRLVRTPAPAAPAGVVGARAILPRLVLDPIVGGAGGGRVHRGERSPSGASGSHARPPPNRGRGTGGLPICGSSVDRAWVSRGRGVPSVEEHAEPRPREGLGGGTTITTDTHTHPALTRPVPLPAPAGFARPPRLLMVEDEADTALPLVRTLEREGYLVSWVETGRDALAHLARHPADVVVLDLGLPDIDGLDVCRSARGEGYDGGVLMVTGRATEADRVEGLDRGADDYLVKPFGLAELHARVRAVLRRTASAAARRRAGGGGPGQRPRRAGPTLSLRPARSTTSSGCSPSARARWWPRAG